MIVSRALTGLMAGLAGLFALAGRAEASWLDSDFYCRVYGCVIVHDGRTFDVYDNYVFATGGVVPRGGRMIPWSGNPFQGAGAVNPVFTGTRTEGFHTVPIEEEGILLGIDQTGNGTIDLGPGANQRGFLDASGVFQAFELDSGSRLVAQETAAQRSFYLSSRTGFYLRARAQLVGPQGGLANEQRLANIAFLFDITEEGVDDGVRFGQNARANFRLFTSVDDLGDLLSGPTDLVEFRNAIRQRNSDDLPSQSIRFDYTYGFEDYDLSMGAGHLRYTIEFDFYNR